MTDMGKPRGTAGPPWSIDLLAELHAGALDEAQSAELWPQVQADPEARAVLEALDATTADLAGLAEAPAPPMPVDVAARIDAALAAEAARAGAPAAPEASGGQQPGQPERLAPVVNLEAARRRRNRQLGWGAGLVSTAAAAVAAVAILSPSSTTGGTPMAGPDKNDSSAPPPGASEPLAVSPKQPEAAFGDVYGVQDYGGLQSRAGLEACLQAHDIPTDGTTAGIRPAKVEGKDAVLAVLTTGKLATYRIVAVSPECSADSPGELYIDKTFGRSGG